MAVMAFQYTNRKGKTYTLQEGKTKSGLPRYFMAVKQTGTAVDDVPAGYEIWENPESCQVYVRKIRPSPILPAERDFLDNAIREFSRRKHFILDVDDRHLVIYLLDRNPDDVARLMGLMFGDAGRRVAELDNWTVTHGHYHKMMRFTLVDDDKRLFSVDRWCFRGPIDDWISLFVPPAPLSVQCEKYLPHLGEEGFFEQM